LTAGASAPAGWGRSPTCSWKSTGGLPGGKEHPSSQTYREIGPGRVDREKKRDQAATRTGASPGPPRLPEAAAGCSGAGFAVSTKGTCGGRRRARMHQKGIPLLRLNSCLRTHAQAEAGRDAGGSRPAAGQCPAGSTAGAVGWLHQNSSAALRPGVAVAVPWSWVGERKSRARRRAHVGGRRVVE